MSVSEPRKETDGDALFTASLQWDGPRTVGIGDQIILDRNQPKNLEDPGFQVLTRSSSNGSDPASSPPALHNYYSEFRLGHGDPLLKAAMSTWPHTTTEYSSPTSPRSSKAVRAGSCTTLLDPSSGSCKLPIPDGALLHEPELAGDESDGERRFVLVDEDG